MPHQPKLQFGRSIPLWPSRTVRGPPISVGALRYLGRQEFLVLSGGGSMTRMYRMGSRRVRDVFRFDVPSGKLTWLWKITMFNGKTHYFNGHVQVRKLLVITRGCQILAASLMGIRWDTRGYHYFHHQLGVHQIVLERVGKHGKPTTWCWWLWFEIWWWPKSSSTTWGLGSLGFLLKGHWKAGLGMSCLPLHCPGAGGLFSTAFWCILCHIQCLSLWQDRHLEQKVFDLQFDTWVCPKLVCTEKNFQLATTW